MRYHITKSGLVPMRKPARLMPKFLAILALLTIIVLAARANDMVEILAELENGSITKFKHSRLILIRTTDKPTIEQVNGQYYIELTTKDIK